MTSEHISSTAEGKQAAVPQSTAVEVEHPAFHYNDKARLASYRRTAPRPPAAPAGAVIALLVGVMVIFAEWALFEQGAQDQTEADWALGFMVISTAGALRILMGNPGRHVVSGALILIAGVSFLIRPLLLADDGWPVFTFELVCGVLLVLASLMTLLSPVLELEPGPGSDPWG